MFKIINLKYILILLVFSFSTVYAGAQTDVENVYHAWCSAIATAKGNPKKVTQFYAPGAILLPTLSSKLLINTDNGMDQYFINLTNKKDIACYTKNFETRLFDDIAINTGFYEFTFTEKDGGLKKIDSRFSFVYQKTNGKWLIVSHHSSKVPKEQMLKSVSNN